MEHSPELNEKLIELELAKSNNKDSKVRKYLPAVVIVASFYYSILLAIGLAVGYVGSKILSKYFLETGKVESIFVDFGKWKLHLHHWITGAVVLLLLVIVYKFNLTGFLAGIIFGVMAHDVYDFNDWHKVLVKNEEYIKTK